MGKSKSKPAQRKASENSKKEQKSQTVGCFHCSKKKKGKIMDDIEVEDQTSYTDKRIRQFGGENGEMGESSQISSQNQPIEMKIVGLENCGSTCWFNSFIHFLFQLSDFRKLIYEFNPPKQAEIRESNVVKMMFLLRKLFVDMQEAKRSTLNPRTLTNKIHEIHGIVSGRESYGQQDSMEMMLKVIEWTELALRKAKSPEDPVEDSNLRGLFYGVLVENKLGDPPNRVESSPMIFHLDISLGNFHSAMESFQFQRHLDKEVWSEELPPVLFFNPTKSRFVNGHFEPIEHEFFCDDIIYMDRYLSENIDLVKKLRDKKEKMLDAIEEFQEEIVRLKSIPDTLSEGQQWALFHHFDPFFGKETLRKDYSDHGHWKKDLLDKSDEDERMSEIERTEDQEILQNIYETLANKLINIPRLEGKIKKLKHKIETIYEVPELRKVAYQKYYVIIHSGTTQGGHYWACVRNGDGWIQMNDTSVRRITNHQFLSDTIGGDRCYGSAHCYIYVREDERDRLFREIPLPKQSKEEERRREIEGRVKMMESFISSIHHQSLNHLLKQRKKSFYDQFIQPVLSQLYRSYRYPSKHEWETFCEEKLLEWTCFQKFIDQHQPNSIFDLLESPIDWWEILDGVIPSDIIKLILLDAIKDHSPTRAVTDWASGKIEDDLRPWESFPREVLLAKELWYKYTIMTVFWENLYEASQKLALVFYQGEIRRIDRIIEANEALSRVWMICDRMAEIHLGQGYTQKDSFKLIEKWITIEMLTSVTQITALLMSCKICETLRDVLDGRKSIRDSEYEQFLTLLVRINGWREEDPLSEKTMTAIRNQWQALKAYLGNQDHKGPRERIDECCRNVSSVIDGWSLDFGDVELKSLPSHSMSFSHELIRMTLSHLEQALNIYPNSPESYESAVEMVCHQTLSYLIHSFSPKIGSTHRKKSLKELKNESNEPINERPSQWSQDSKERANLLDRSGTSSSDRDRQYRINPESSPNGTEDSKFDLSSKSMPNPGLADLGEKESIQSMHGKDRENETPILWSGIAKQNLKKASKEYGILFGKSKPSPTPRVIDVGEDEDPQTNHIISDLKGSLNEFQELPNDIIMKENERAGSDYEDAIEDSNQKHDECQDSDHGEHSSRHSQSLSCSSLEDKQERQYPELVQRTSQSTLNNEGHSGSQPFSYLSIGDQKYDHHHAFDERGVQDISEFGSIGNGRSNFNQKSLSSSSSRDQQENSGQGVGQRSCQDNHEFQAILHQVGHSGNQPLPSKPNVEKEDYHHQVFNHRNSQSGNEFGYVWSQGSNSIGRPPSYSSTIGDQHDTYQIRGSINGELDQDLNYLDETQEKMNSNEQSKYGPNQAVHTSSYVKNNQDPGLPSHSTARSSLAGTPDGLVYDITKNTQSSSKYLFK